MAVPNAHLVRGSYLVLGALAVLCVLNSFFSHLTPDLAIYLLHARTFVETLNRYTLSLDSKGFLLTVALAPGVAVFGANVTAAAATQLIFHLLGGLGLYAVLRNFLPRSGALGIALIQLIVVHSHLLWGGNSRPEDFAVGYLGVAMLAAARTTPTRLIAGGAAAAAALLTKSTLVLAPLGVLVVAAFFQADGETLDKARRWRRSLARFAWIALGFGSVVAAGVLWLTFFDSLSGWWHQSFVWPRTFHALALPTPRDVGACVARFIETRLIFVLVPAVAGFWLGWKSGYRRESAIGAVIVILESARVLLENGKWPYSLTPMVPALLIGVGLLDWCIGRQDRRRLPGLLIPVLALLPLLATTVTAEFQAATHLVVKRLPSPSEDLAEAMREAGYLPSQTIFPVTYGTPMFLLLDAPRPYPILPLYFDRVGLEEQAATRNHYRDHPPVWVLRRCDPPLPFHRQAGAIDHAFHVVVEKTRAPSKAVDPRIAAGNSLSPILSAGDWYRLILETGEFDVWRLEEEEQLE